ncbi:hypothetical protein BV898_14049 [Hypsibius exemplaris]|uniref:Uncharacterized protein n=1 Tax=Hypsibius exemplaris TaxID=2072580 RepID=A0A1W0W8U8_HYPEX|nr:hypothetical protein BV898_14049 [Hypsibius exemplaris]
MQGPCGSLEWQSNNADDEEVLMYTRGKFSDQIWQIHNRTIDLATLKGQPSGNEPFCAFRNDNPACEAN